MPKPKPAPQTEPAQAEAPPLQPIFRALPEASSLAEQKQLLSSERVDSYRNMDDDSKTPAPTMKTAAGQIAKRRPPSKLPGYVLPSREGKVGLSTHIEPELREAFKAIARLNGTTAELLLREVLIAVVEHYQNPEHVGASVTATVDRYRSAVNKAALRLVSTPSK